MGVYLGPLSETLGPTINLFWWYMFYLWRIVPHLFFKELGFSGSCIYVPIFFFNIPILEEYVFKIQAGPHLL
jgi:hypothetical protein